MRTDTLLTAFERSAPAAISTATSASFAVRTHTFADRSVTHPSIGPWTSGPDFSASAANRLSFIASANHSRGPATSRPGGMPDAIACFAAATAPSISFLPASAAARKKGASQSSGRACSNFRDHASTASYLPASTAWACSRVTFLNCPTIFFGSGGGLGFFSFAASSTGSAA